MPWKKVAARGGTLHFDGVGGRAELWVDGVKLASKQDAAPAPLSARLPAAPGARTIVLIVEAPPGEASGLLGAVAITAD